VRRIGNVLSYGKESTNGCKNWKAVICRISSRPVPSTFLSFVSVAHFSLIHSLL
jgi:hypothetical protein